MKVDFIPFFIVFIILQLIDITSFMFCHDFRFLWAKITPKRLGFFFNPGLKPGATIVPPLRGSL